jgi:hypothetical protein
VITLGTYVNAFSFPLSPSNKIDPGLPPSPPPPFALMLPKYPPFLPLTLLFLCDSLVLPKTGRNELVSKCVPSVFTAKEVSYPSTLLSIASEVLNVAALFTNTCN